MSQMKPGVRNARNNLVIDMRLKYDFCHQCGKLFFPKNSRQIFCSDDCRRRAVNYKHDHRISKEALIDKDITLEKLALRDNGICHICGKPVDWNDINNGIAGNNYPSIDHVYPLSKGGKHSWDNIKLAHRHCNTIKGARCSSELH